MAIVKRNLMDSLRLGDRDWRGVTAIQANDVTLLGDTRWNRTALLVADDSLTTYSDGVFRFYQTPRVVVRVQDDNLILDNRINGRQSTTWLS